MTEASKQSVRVATQRPTSTPAIFLLASFTVPAWEPIELEAKPVPSTEGAASAPSEAYEFSKTFELAEGKYEYRFRVGTDDISFCNTEMPTSTDKDGNVNNILLVEKPSHAEKEAPEAEDSKPEDATGISHETTEETSDKGSGTNDEPVVQEEEPEPKADIADATSQTAEGAPAKAEDADKDLKTSNEELEPAVEHPADPSVPAPKGKPCTINSSDLKLTNLAEAPQQTELDSPELTVEDDAAKPENAESNPPPEELTPAAPDVEPPELKPEPTPETPEAPVASEETEPTLPNAEVEAIPEQSRLDQTSTISEAVTDAPAEAPEQLEVPEKPVQETESEASELSEPSEQTEKPAEPENIPEEVTVPVEPIPETPSEPAGLVGNTEAKSGTLSNGTSALNPAAAEFKPGMPIEVPTPKPAEGDEQPTALDDTVASDEATEPDPLDDGNGKKEALGPSPESEDVNETTKDDITTTREAEQTPLDAAIVEQAEDPASEPTSDAPKASESNADAEVTDQAMEHQDESVPEKQDLAQVVEDTQAPPTEQPAGVAEIEPANHQVTEMTGEDSSQSQKDDIPPKEPVCPDEEPSDDAIASTAGTTPLETGPEPVETDKTPMGVAATAEPLPEESVVAEAMSKDVAVEEVGKEEAKQVEEQQQTDETNAKDDITTDLTAEVVSESAEQSPVTKLDQETMTSGEVDNADLPNEDDVTHANGSVETAEENLDILSSPPSQQPVEIPAEPAEPQKDVAEDAPASPLATCEEDLSQLPGIAQSSGPSDTTVVDSDKEAPSEVPAVAEPAAEGQTQEEPEANIIVNGENEAVEADQRPNSELDSQAVPEVPVVEVDPTENPETATPAINKEDLETGAKAEDATASVEDAAPIDAKTKGGAPVVDDNTTSETPIDVDTEPPSENSDGANDVVTSVPKVDTSSLNGDISKDELPAAQLNTEPDATSKSAVIGHETTPQKGIEVIEATLLDSKPTETFVDNKSDPLPDHTHSSIQKLQTEVVEPSANKEPEVEPIAQLAKSQEDSKTIEDVEKANGNTLVASTESVAEVPELKPLPLTAEPALQATELNAANTETPVQNKVVSEAPLPTQQPLELTPETKSNSAIANTDPTLPVKENEIVKDKVVSSSVVKGPASDNSAQVPAVPVVLPNALDKPEDALKAGTDNSQQPAFVESASTPAASRSTVTNSTGEPSSPPAVVSKKTQNGPPSTSDLDVKQAQPTADGTISNAATEPVSAADGSKSVTKNANEPQRPPTANQSVTSLTTHKRDSFFRALWRAVFQNFLGGLFSAFRRRDRPSQ
ncbi:predicted protein [Uncinocarpus reesii 1704]|uniref:AMP-activated protein kinase glycogen-binding domain-containing protein n=1 Tax=Uncinocarpus reesii (strain UAMH 1704) TaxID=336963 RepID=C4JUU0_UNCRE|nr:uncharacterized protein UREG_04893 [Uncinocarpus reesii 1704]EEP80051.1 predicted protein [Uncinocarpus reesii 1704]